MSGLLSVHNAVIAWRTHGGEKIHHLTERDREILGWLKNNGIDFNTFRMNVRGID
jgi:hypothetical protein